MSFSRSISVLVLATTLAACGGNGGGGSPEVNVTAPSDNSSRSSKSGLLVVSGKAASGSTVEVTFPDGSKKSILVGSSGTYSLSSDRPQSSGNVDIVSIDNNGNESPVATSSYTDNTPPQKPENTVSKSQYNGAAVVEGTAEPGASVTVTFPDNTKKTVTASADGKFKAVSAQAQDTGQIAITVTDINDNASAPMNLSFVDRTPPRAPTDTIATSSNTGIATISGKAEVGTTVTVTFPDGTSKTQFIESDGTFKLTSNSAQPSGIASITSTDADKNKSQETIATFVNATTPSNLTVTSTANGILTVSGKAVPQSTVTVTFPDGSKKTTTADGEGNINFSVASGSTQQVGEISAVSSNSNGVDSETAYLTMNNVVAALYKATGEMPALGFEPSLGINTEAPQGGVDSAGTPIPFVDIFRTALPFNELSGSDAKFDTYGWTTKLASGRTVARTKLLQGARPGSIPDGMYTVLYDVTGDNPVSLDFNQRGPTVTNTKKVSGKNKYTFDLALQNFDSDIDAQAQVNAILLNVRGLSPDSYAKNIRVIMPGGTCRNSAGEYNHFVRALSDADCPKETSYVSFEERLAANRNEIIFNPDYLMFLRNFKVVRMMNLMEASLKDLCGGTETHCPDGVGNWSHRANIKDSVWGGNDGRTKPEDHKGVPVEVMIALANIIKKDIWINIPHVATDDYVSNYAQQVFNDLDSSLKVYVEYSNEVWNSGFAGYQYMTKAGLKVDGYDSIPSDYKSLTGSTLDFKKVCDTKFPKTTEENIQKRNSARCENYFARLRYFSNRSVEIFDIWENQFGKNSPRLERVLGSFVGDKLLTELMIDHIQTSKGKNKVDSVAIAPYFFACTIPSQCPNADHSLINATTVDDVFNAMKQAASKDVKSLDGTIAAVKSQLETINAHNTKTSNDIKLVTYEGGQHLVTGVFGSNIDEADKPRLRKLFHKVNRDPRMTERYQTFLDAWKALSTDGATLFTLYTMPQSYYRFGNFGISEHLNMPRAQSPKFDGAMKFQEAVETCWWDYCNNN